MEKEKINSSALKNPWFYISVIAVISIFILSYVIIKSKSTGDVIQGEEQVQEIQQRQQVQQRQQNTISVSEDDDAVLGNENAPVTIIEFSDYECPFCARFFSGAYSQIKEKYIDTGKVKLIYRDFPLSFHPNAQKAAEAAECAGDQNKYYEMHDKIFENQQAITTTDLKNYAKEIDLNLQDFNACLDSGEMASEVRKDFQDGQSAGVQGTPTFFINEQKIVGAQPFSAFEEIIEGEL